MMAIEVGLSTPQLTLLLIAAGAPVVLAAVAGARFRVPMALWMIGPVGAANLGTLAALRMVLYGGPTVSALSEPWDYAASTVRSACETAGLGWQIAAALGLESCLLLGLATAVGSWTPDGAPAWVANSRGAAWALVWGLGGSWAATLVLASGGYFPWVVAAVGVSVAIASARVATGVADVDRTVDSHASLAALAVLTVIASGLGTTKDALGPFASAVAPHVSEPARHPNLLLDLCQREGRILVATAVALATTLAIVAPSCGSQFRLVRRRSVERALAAIVVASAPLLTVGLAVGLTSYFSTLRQGAWVAAVDSVSGLPPAIGTLEATTKHDPCLMVWDGNRPVVDAQANDCEDAFNGPTYAVPADAALDDVLVLSLDKPDFSIVSRRDDAHWFFGPLALIARPALRVYVADPSMPWGKPVALVPAHATVGDLFALCARQPRDPRMPCFIWPQHGIP
jgi:hypothetical protein